MKKLWPLVVIIFLLLPACVSMDQYRQLERRVSSLEGEKFFPKDAMILAQEAGAAKFWWRSALLGNSASSVDGITGASNGDAAMMVSLSGTVATGYLYVYDADGTYSDYPVGCSTECARIAADGMTVGAWQLAKWYTASLVSAADDGYHYINASNSTNPSYTPSDGDCYYKRDDRDWCCYDSVKNGTGGWWCSSFN